MIEIMIKLKWPDGTITRGETPEEVLTRIGNAQWNPVDRKTIMQMLSDRAWVWSGSAVDDTKPCDEFLHDLEQAGMFEITCWD